MTNRAGLFAGEVTDNAPVDGAATNKPKSYVWMQYGGVGSPIPFLYTMYINDTDGILPLPELGEGGEVLIYNCFVDWDYESVSILADNPVTVTAYNAAAASYDFVGEDDTFTISIEAPCGGFSFRDGNDFNNTDMVDIVQWGDPGLKFVEGMFYGCTGLNVTATDTPNLIDVTSLHEMFYNTDMSTATALGDWDVGNIVTFWSMFESSSFDTDIGAWDVSNGTDFYGMFRDTPFNQNIGAWDVGNAEYLGQMFMNNTVFNQDISAWDVSNCRWFDQMFDGATLFNQDLGSWDVSSGEEFESMFRDSAFDQDISGWTPTEATGFDNFLLRCNISVANYDLLLNAWSLLTFTNTGLIFDCDQNYTIATSQAARDILTGPPNNWIITDNGGI